MTYDLILTGAHCVLPDPNSQPHSLTIEQTDIAILDGKIAAIGSLGSAKAKAVKDLKGLHILPGIIDSQVHFREPGLTHKEDLASGTASAALGGVTAIFEMPNTSPSTTTEELFREKLSRAENRCFSHYAFFIGASPENVEELAHLERLPGCSGIKIFMGSSTGNLLVDSPETLARIFKVGQRRIAIHAEDEYRLRERKPLAIESGDVAFHPHWRDEITALNATKLLHETANKAGRPAHLLHVSTGDEMDFLKGNKGVLSVEILPQHLTLSAPECYERLGTLAQMNPPIRSQEHQDRLWKALTDGTVDVIGSEHAPHTLEEKAKPYPESPSGMPGVQTLVPIMLNHVNNKRLSLEHFVRLASANPARLYQAKGKGHIAVGADADLTVIDLKKQATIDNRWIATKAGWTPYDGMTVTGWPVGTLLLGEWAMWEGELSEKALGQRVSFEGELAQ